MKVLLYHDNPKINHVPNTLIWFVKCRFPFLFLAPTGAQGITMSVRAAQSQQDEVF